MMRTFTYIFIFGFLASNTGLRAQCDSKYTTDADKAYRGGFYFQALQLYEKAKDKAKKDKAAAACVNFMMAQCNRKLGDYKKAFSLYQKAQKMGFEDPKAIWYMAIMYKNQGMYDEAMAEFQNYKKLVPNDARADKAIESCKNAANWRKNPTCYNVENIKALNSRDNDYSPVYASRKSDVLIFSSSREGAKGKEDGVMGLIPEDLFEAKISKKGTWGAPTPLGDEVNTKESEGAAAMNKRFNIMYFTRCSQDKKSKVGCQIYEVKKQGQKWAEPVKIALAPDSCVVGHPTISNDGNYMIFSSNMPGGKGGMDLWMAKYDKKKKTFADPVNLKDLNTEFNETYPYLRADDKLYFSSDRIEGMGGLDIYRAAFISEGKWDKPVNMRYPINSEGDDFAIVFEGNDEKGLFTSNRKGGRGKDDIYSFNITKASVNVVVTVKDVDTKKPIQGVKVSFVAASGETKDITTDASGKANLNPANYGEDYELKASKDNYFNANGAASTRGIDPLVTCKDTTIYAEILMKTSDVPLNFEVLFYYDQAEFYPEFKDTLDKIVRILKENPTMRVELGAHTDSRGRDEYNKDLSERRAKRVVEYIVSQGIEAERLKAQGYGESQPRVMEMDLGILKKGQKLDEAFINSLPTEADRETAHKLNRRVTLKKIDNNYKPKTPPPPKKEEE